MRNLRILTLALTVLIGCQFGSALAGTIPQEPEIDNGEYFLDVVTNEYTRWWREIWDAGDNRIRFRLGSNNTGQWFMEEELKVTSDLLANRLRFRYYHGRLLRYTTYRIAADVLELEGRLYRKNYLSLLIRPTLDKRESSIGLMFQHREATNRFVKVSVEWPHFLNNFSERRRDRHDSLLTIYTDHPTRYAFDLRERIIPGIWVGATGEFIPEFEMGDELTATQEKIPKERADAKVITGWAEYILNPSRGLREQTAFGINAGYRKERKSKDPECQCSFWDDRVVGDTARDDRGIWAVPQTYFEGDLYGRTEEDTVMAWRESRWFLSPYAWVVVNDRLTVRASVRFEEREIAIGNDNEQAFYTVNKYIVPTVGARYAFGKSRLAILEMGIVSEFRRRTEERTDDPFMRMVTRKENFDDNRMYIAFEYVFGDSKILRLNEAIELDAQDWGEFRIHDHGFFQLIFEF
ncbi:MAG: hypothetical protein JSW58_09420 [Candidatus Latescibacterota bacterium]|nr:MAG: hypothetical protein JSW58_09420 [Candidatus Latescibacterota bacterium]